MPWLLEVGQGRLSLGLLASLSHSGGGLLSGWDGTIWVAVLSTMVFVHLFSCGTKGFQRRAVRIHLCPPLLMTLELICWFHLNLIRTWRNLQVSGGSQLVLRQSPNYKINIEEGKIHINDKLCQILLQELHPQTLKAVVRGKYIRNQASLALLSCRTACSVSGGKTTIGESFIAERAVGPAKYMGTLDAGSSRTVTRPDTFRSICSAVSKPKWPNCPQMETVMEKCAVVKILGNLDPWSKTKVWRAEIADELIFGFHYNW